MKQQKTNSFFFILAFVCLCSNGLKAQSVAINTDASPPHASAMLDIKSNVKGLLIPRMTTAEKNAIASPAEGLKVFDTDTKTFWFYNGTGWIESATGSPTNFWTLNGTDIYNNNTGNVGIGTNVPSGKLTIQTGTAQTGWKHIAGADEIIVSEDIGGVSASLGTMTNHAFRLKANGVGGFHLYPGGKLVAGTNGFAPSSFGRLTIESDLGYGLNHTDGTISVGTYVGGIPATGWFGTISNHPLSFFANNGGALMTILQNGNVGIGNNSPSDKLHITGSSRMSGLQKIDGANTLEFGFGIGGKEVNAGKIGYQTFTAGALDIIGAGTVSGNRKIKFWTEGGAEFAGTMGIGTTANPLYRLSVNGIVRSTEVVVETGWADYVFEKNYRLLPLEEVEKFIQQNKHLPNIPSAKEIESNGLQVGNTQKRMMEKIEELTLYVIELKKEIEVLKNKK